MPERKTLEDIYEEVMLEEPWVDLGSFLDRVAGGEFGSFTADEIREFLRAVEDMMVENIYLKASEHPVLDEMKEERIEETREMIARYIDKYAKPGGDGQKVGNGR